MWTAIYVATSLEEAEKIQKALTDEGFLVKNQFFAKEGNEMLYEILVPEAESEEAQLFLYEIGLIY